MKYLVIATRNMECIGLAITLLALAFLYVLHLVTTL